MQFLSTFSELVKSLPNELKDLSEICPDDHRLDEFALAVDILYELQSEKFSYLGWHLHRLPYQCLARLTDRVNLDYLLECAKFLCMPDNLISQITESFISDKLPHSKWNTLGIWNPKT